MNEGYEDYKRAVLRVIVESRKARGLEQKHMAHKMGIAQSSYSRIETGKTELSLDAILCVAGELNVAPSALLERAELIMREVGPCLIK